jgi:hypothetical protein
MGLVAPFRRFFRTDTKFTPNSSLRQVIFSIAQGDSPNESGRGTLPSNHLALLCFPLGNIDSRPATSVPRRKPTKTLCVLEGRLIA